MRLSFLQRAVGEEALARGVFVFLGEFGGDATHIFMSWGAVVLEWVGKGRCEYQMEAVNVESALWFFESIDVWPV